MPEEISDGYHTFGELYEHRHALFALVCSLLPNESWKTHIQGDGEACPDGWFLAGLCYQPGEQLSYHLPEAWWPAIQAHELRQAPPWDGHSSQDVLDRLKQRSTIHAR